MERASSGSPHAPCRCCSSSFDDPSGFNRAAHRRVRCPSVSPPASGCRRGRRRKRIDADAVVHLRHIHCGRGSERSGVLPASELVEVASAAAQLPAKTCSARRPVVGSPRHSGVMEVLASESALHEAHRIHHISHDRELRPRRRRSRLHARVRSVRSETRSCSSLGEAARSPPEGARERPVKAHGSGRERLQRSRIAPEQLATDQRCTVFLVGGNEIREPAELEELDVGVDEDRQILGACRQPEVEPFGVRPASALDVDPLAPLEFLEHFDASVGKTRCRLP